VPPSPIACVWPLVLLRVLLQVLGSTT